MLFNVTADWSEFWTKLFLDIRTILQERAVSYSHVLHEP